MRKIVLVLMMSFSILYGNSIFNINLNSTDLEVGLEKISKYSRNTKIYSSFAYLQGEDEFDYEQKILQGEVMVVGLTSIPGFSVGMGVKGVTTKIDFPRNEQSVIGLGIKLKALYTLPLAIKSYATASYTYAPSSLSFSDLANYKELRLQGNFEVIDGGIIYVGYRSMEMDFEKIRRTYEFNDSFYVGVKFVFN